MYRDKIDLHYLWYLEGFLLNFMVMIIDPPSLTLITYCFTLNYLSKSIVYPIHPAMLL